MLGQDGNGRANLAGRAIPALESVMAHEGGLHRMEVVAFRQAFDGGDVIAGVHHRQRQAAVDALAVDDDRARAALPLVASLLGAGEREPLAKRIKQRGAGVERQSFVSAVDPKSDGDGGRRRLDIGQAGTQRSLRMTD
jgi:hypothetical protein